MGNGYGVPLARLALARHVMLCYENATGVLRNIISLTDNLSTFVATCCHDFFLLQLYNWSTTLLLSFELLSACIYFHGI